jgi:hypothetical protein
MDKIGHSSTMGMAVPSPIASERSLNQPKAVLNSDATRKGVLLNDYGSDSTEQTEGHLEGPQLLFAMFSAMLAGFFDAVGLTHCSQGKSRC